MKNTFIKGVALLAIASFTLFSCSSDNDTQTNSSNTSIMERNSGEVYSDFKGLMTDLYTDKQKVEVTVEYRLDEETYNVTEVTVDAKLQGYFLENLTTKEVVYLSENKSNGTLDYFIAEKGIVSKKVYDLTLDPNYATDGFSPKNASVAGRRFWGNEVHASGGIAQNTDGTPGCFQGLYQTHYVFWIATGHETPVKDENGNNAYISVPCP